MAGSWGQTKRRQGERQGISLPASQSAGISRALVKIAALLQAAGHMIIHSLPPLAAKARAIPVSTAQL